jgi:hypothetical protein
MLGVAENFIGELNQPQSSAKPMVQGQRIAHCHGLLLNIY